MVKVFYMTYFVNYALTLDVDRSSEGAMLPT